MISFFQDDWYHLYQVYNKSLLEVLRYFNLFQKGQVDPLNFYRPLSTKLYFFLTYNIFGLKPIFFSIINISLFTLNAFLFAQIAKKITDKKMLAWTTFFYVFSLAHFTLFGYITKVEDLFLAIFSFGSILCWIKKRSIFLSLSLFIGALTSRESALMIPLVLANYQYLIKKQKVKKIIKKLFPWLLITAVYAGLRTFIYGWPKDKNVYKITLLGLHPVNNLLKYLQWNLNITGLIKLKNAFSYLSLLSLIILCLITLLSIHKIIKKKAALKICAFGVIWWLIFLLPVLFFSDHRDPWNLAVASGGMALIIAQIIKSINKPLKIVFISSYLVLFILGLNFYRQNHWTVTRAKIIENSINTVRNQCSQDKITISANSEKELKELKYSWYYDLGPKVLCQKENIDVVYEKK